MKYQPENNEIPFLSANADSIIDRDVQYVWHPGYQLKRDADTTPMIVTGAKGSYIALADGTNIIDAISSWWCKSLGHQHPRLQQALYRQAEQFEHVMLANTTNETIVNLSEKLAHLSPGLTKVCYGGDGSTAIEIALKISLHARVAQGDRQRTQFIALSQGYHGESIATLSVSDVGLYREPYQLLLFDSYFLQNIPYVNCIDDPSWHDCSLMWPDIENQLMPYKQTATAIILEPIVQSVAGMKLYSQDFLRRLRQWSNENNIHLIADEIMTGVGRTGKMLACEYANITPDFICLGKSLTAGWLPLSAVITSNEIYKCFYDSDTPEKMFAHSNTYSGNVLAASIANEVLDIFATHDICTQANDMGKRLLQGMQTIADDLGKLSHVRGIGAIVAADFANPQNDPHLNAKIYQKAIENGLLLRPTGNTIYWVPPLNTRSDTVEDIISITHKIFSDL